MKLQFICPGGTWAAGLQHIPSDPFAPPLGILYLSSLLELAGHTVHVIDYWGEQFNQDRLKSCLNNCDAVGVSITGFNLQESLYICHEIKEIDADIPLLIGGPYVTLYPKKSVIESHADIGIEGEGEPGIVKIVDALQGKAEINQVEGVIYHEKDRIKRGKAPSIVSNLDTLPFPSRSLVKKYQYGFILGAKVTKGKTTSFLSSRGCPMNCRFY